MSRANAGLHHAAADAILSQRAALAEALVRLEFARRPELVTRYGQSGRDKSLRDADYHLAYLAEAVRLDSTPMFLDYMGWVKPMLVKRGVDSDVINNHLQCMREVLSRRLSPELSTPACKLVELALQDLPGRPDEPAAFVKPAVRFARLARSYLEAMLHWERGAANEMIVDAIKHDVSLEDLYFYVFQRTQYEIGRLWQLNVISVAQEHYCSAITQTIMAQMYPQVFSSAKHGGTMIATAVCGDMHEIGIRMISDVFELRGWNTHYLGSNVPPQGVVQAVVERDADVLCISATISYHVRAVDQLIEAVRASPAGARVKILLGGYAFNVDPRLWRKLGADGYAVDLVAAASIAERLAKVTVRTV